MELSINAKGTLLEFDSPIVMGIINLTPDSFYSGSRISKPDDLKVIAERMLSEGASILDIGAVSTRPGAKAPSVDEEKERLLPAIDALHREFPDTILSVDTFRAAVAREALDAGVGIVNDIGSWNLDPEMLDVIVEARVPYVLMHMAGTPETMQKDPRYEDVVREVLAYFVDKLSVMRNLGLHDLIIDPGFGFGKTVKHNYTLLGHLHIFRMLECPILAGLSRKSMICKVLHINPPRALNGTTALHMLALQQGANILRVHDVREAMETIALFKAYCESNQYLENKV